MGGAGSKKVSAEEADELPPPMFFDKAYEPRPVEVTVVKGADGLGVRMELKQRAWGWALLIKAFKAADGVKGAAERSKKLRIGDAILAINGVDVPRLEGDAMSQLLSGDGASADGTDGGDGGRGSNRDAADAGGKPGATDAESQAAAGSGSEAGAGAEAEAKEQPIDLKQAVGWIRDAPMMLRLRVLRVRRDDEGGGKGGEGKKAKKKRRKNSLAVGIEHATDPTRQAVVQNPDRLHNPGCRDHWEEAMEAAMCGSLFAVKDEVIFHWSRINRKDADRGETLLHVLCREGYVEGARFVLDPSNHAARERVQLVQDVQNNEGRTPLLLVFTPAHLTASARGQPPIENKEPNDVVMAPGDEARRTEIVRMLIRAGASVNVLDLNDFTPLHLAAMWGWGECVRALLRAGATPERSNALGQTALHLACKHGDPERVPEACAAVALLEAVLPSSLDVMMEKKDDRGNNPMHYACMRGLDAVITLMLEKGADAMGPNHHDETPLKLAVRSGRTRAASILMHVPMMMRRKSAVAAAAGEMRAYLEQRLALGAYSAEKRRKQRAAKEKKKWARMTPEERELAQRQQASVNYRKQGDWERFNDPYNGNRVYYYNHATKESQWEAPPDFAEDPRFKARMLARGEGNNLWPQWGEPQRVRPVGPA